MYQNFIEDETEGNKYDQVLRSRSLLQPSPDPNGSCCVMHDLFHDLAKFVSGNSCSSLETTEGSRQVHHVSYDAMQFNNFNLLETPAHSRCLSTFFPLKSQISSIPHGIEIRADYFDKLQGLMVLSLAAYGTSIDRLLTWEI